MKTHQITGSQLRGMIKEALEESLEEFSLDDERMELARLGHRRSPAQNRRYKALLEAKLGYMKEELETPELRTTSAAGKLGAKVEKSSGVSGLVDNLKTDADAAAAITGMIEDIVSKKKPGEKTTVQGIINKVVGQKSTLQKIEKAAKETPKAAAPGAPGVKTGSGAQEAALFNESRRRLLRRR